MTLSTTEQFILNKEKRIKSLDDDSLLKEFEDVIRKGKKVSYPPLVFMKREIKKRMEFGELI